MRQKKQEVDPLDSFMIVFLIVSSFILFTFVMQGINQTLEKENQAKRQKLLEKKGDIKFIQPQAVNENATSLQKGTLLINSEEQEINTKVIEDETEEISASILSFDKKKAKMKPIDHDKVYYAPFKKNFYIPTPEIMKLSSEGNF